MDTLTNTIRLFDNEPYGTEFDATVLSCVENKTSDTIVYQIILDKTLFFPEEGGQSPDNGTINGINVTDVQIKNDVITHTILNPLNKGEKVHGIIDWAHRFSNMQQHSGEHIFSGLVHSTFGYENVGFHLSDKIVTMDFSGVLNDEEVASIEKRANQAIISNLPIEISFPSKEELSSLEYRSKKELSGQVRIVTIPGVDVCACCAPHVSLTGEIGLLKVMDRQNYKGGVRISILCGFRALEAFCSKNSILTTLSQTLSVPEENIIASLGRLQSVIQTQKNQIISLGQEMINSKISSAPNDVKSIVIFEESLEALVMRNAINSYTAEHDGVCAIFSGNDSNGYSYIIGSKKTDCKLIASALHEKFNAKGGGSPAMIQGSLIAAKCDIETVINSTIA